MSHIVKITCQMRDVETLKKACIRRGLEEPVMGSHNMFSGRLHGLGVKLPGWSYPVVINPETGEVKYDNYGGRWGKDSELDLLAQAYEAEKTESWALENGFTVEQETLQDGEVRMLLTQLT